MDIIGMSISSSAVILLIIILRKVFFRFIPKKTVKLLWLAAAVQLLVPINVLSRIGTALCRYSKTCIVSETIEEASLIPIDLPGILIDVTLYEPIKYLWLFGAVFTGAFFFFNHIKTRKIFSCALPCNYDIEPLKGLFNIRRKVILAASEMTDTPFTYGIITPRIILPKAAVPADERLQRNILCHELEHIRSLDVLYKLVILLCVSVHWFNPLVWAMLILSERDIELACDEAAISHGIASREEYAMTLISMEESRCSYYAAGFMGGSLEERIIRIMTADKPRFSTAAAALALLLTLAVSVCVNVYGVIGSESAVAVNDYVYEVLEEAVESVYEEEYKIYESESSDNISYAVENDDTGITVTYVVSYSSFPSEGTEAISDVYLYSETVEKMLRK